MNIKETIQDWGGFERLVASLHETGNVEVEHNVQLKGKSGATRQIDVLIRHRKGLYEHLVVIECKYWNKRVERQHVDTLANTVKEVGAAKGVLFSTKGFQKGAHIQAAHDNIELFKIRNLTNQECKSAGKIINDCIHIIGVSFGPMIFTVQDTLSKMEPTRDLFIHMSASEIDTLMVTGEIYPSKEGETEVKLEEYLIRKIYMRHICSPFHPMQPIKFNNGLFEGDLFLRVAVNMREEEPLQLMTENKSLLSVVSIRFPLGMHLHQRMTELDFSDDYSFAFALEDCIKGVVISALRRTDDNITILKKIENSNNTVLLPARMTIKFEKSPMSFDWFSKLKIGKWVEDINF